MERYASEADYLAALAQRGVLPKGFRVASTRLSFVPNERPTQEPYAMNLALLMADRPTDSFAGVFTRNAFPGAPVILARKRMNEERVQGVLVNNKISNVCTATGIEDAESLLETLSPLVGAGSRRLFSVSTGIIGWSLPVREMQAAMPHLVSGLDAGTALEFARAIMTTDSFPKIRCAEVGTGRIVAIAKGAGMIEPNLATMLVFIMSDLDVSRDDARRALGEAAGKSFNRISVDSDQSTSDMVLFLSTRAAGAVAYPELARALSRVCSDLAEDIVRNGEGTSHVIKVHVSGMKDESTAAEAGKAVINSPLVKTAIYGNDPNVGRIVSSLGDFAGNRGVAVSREKLRISLGPHEVFADGVFHLDRDKEVALSAYLQEAAMNPRITGYPQHGECVEIHADFGLGSGAATVIGSDLSHEYIQENADYRT